MKYLGVDMGGSKISAALIDEKGKVLTESSSPTQADTNRETIINNIIKTIKAVDDKTVKTIGLGIPGVPSASGKIPFIPNIKPLQNQNVKLIIESKIKKKIILENDSNCFAIAENKLGVGKNKNNMVGLIIGTGVGAGIIINKEIYRGHNGFAGEVGHMKTRINDQEIEFEELISGRGFLKKYIEAGGKLAKIEEINKNTNEFKIAYAKWLDELETLLRHIIKMFSPELIVVGGGLSNFDFYKEMNSRIKKAIPHTKCKIVKNSLGSDAGRIGAALLTK